MDPAVLTGSNPVGITGTDSNQIIGGNLLPNTTNLPFDTDSFGEKIKEWFRNLGSGIENIADYFKDNFPDSIFNIGSNKIPKPTIDPPSKTSEPLYGVDLPDWVSDLFNKAIDMYHDNLNRQYSYNAEQAEKDRMWQEYMSNTAYQRAMADLKAAGINPLLALGGMSGASTPGGSSASGSLGNSNSLFSSIASAVGTDKKILASLLTAIIGIFKVFSGKSSSSIISNNTNNNRSIIDFFNH